MKSEMNELKQLVDTLTEEIAYVRKDRQQSVEKQKTPQYEKTDRWEEKLRQITEEQNATIADLKRQLALMPLEAPWTRSDRPIVYPVATQV